MYGSFWDGEPTVDRLGARYKVFCTVMSCSPGYADGMLPTVQTLQHSNDKTQVEGIFHVI